MPNVREKNLQFYTWDRSDKKPELYIPFKSDDFKDQPITIVAYLEANLLGFDKVSLSSTLDRLGKVNGYYLNLSQTSKPKSVIDSPPSKIEFSFLDVK